MLYLGLGDPRTWLSHVNIYRHYGSATALKTSFETIQPTEAINSDVATSNVKHTHSHICCHTKKPYNICKLQTEGLIICHTKQISKCQLLIVIKLQKLIITNLPYVSGRIRAGKYKRILETLSLIKEAMEICRGSRKQTKESTILPQKNNLQAINYKRLKITFEEGKLKSNRPRNMFKINAKQTRMTIS